ncbi:MAG: cation:proton antiporter, partial [Spirochaetia bacterium]|nr:cation:proton antiporter [Spirochaetia bacterium]
MPFFPAPHSDVLSLLIQISLLLFLAKAFGEISMRLGQPSVVGEIFAGIVLGPSVLGALLPEISNWWLPTNEVQGYLLETVSLIGAIFLLTLTGLETDLKLIRIHARTAISVSLAGIIATMSSGFLLGMYLPESILPSENKRL